MRQQRLAEWSSVNVGVEYAEWVERGSAEGIEFYHRCQDIGEDYTSLINNFNWL